MPVGAASLLLPFSRSSVVATSMVRWLLPFPVWPRRSYTKGAVTLQQLTASANAQQSFTAGTGVSSILPSYGSNARARFAKLANVKFVTIPYLKITVTSTLFASDEMFTLSYPAGYEPTNTAIGFDQTGFVYNADTKQLVDCTYTAITSSMIRVVPVLQVNAGNYIFGCAPIFYV